MLRRLNAFVAESSRATSLAALLPVVSVMLLLGGCPADGGGVIDPTEVKDCEDSTQCSDGTVCVAGACTPGQCDPALESKCEAGEDSNDEARLCCKPWEDCNGLSLSCVRDEESPIGCRPDEPNCEPCEVDEDCPLAGQFCSGGRCFDTAGRDGCTSSHQCPTGERCDRTVFLCVPDKGGCNFCGELSELCCEDNTEICSEQSGFCLPLEEPECAADQPDDCPQGRFCDSLSRCIECDADHPCGPNLLCDTGLGSCYSDADRCTSDAGCPGDTCECNGSKRCAEDTGLCVVAECERDLECTLGGDDRRVCNLGTFKCELPPPVCDEEADEPNGGIASAAPLTDGVNYAGKLCRADTDVLSFPVTPGHRYTATVNFGGSGQSGILVSMLDSSGATESSNTFTATQASVQVAGVTGEDETGLFYVRVIGNNQERDQWSYTVSVVEQVASPPADCTEAGQPEEPNNSVDDAHALAPGQTHTVTRCGTADEDYYRITVPALNGLEVTVAGFVNAEGNINVQLLKGSSPSTSVAQGVGTSDVERVTGPEGESTYILKVKLGNTSGALVNQVYTITPVLVPRPAACSPDATENDGSIASAAELPLITAVDGTVTATLDSLVRCNPQDVDFFRFTVPQSQAATVQLSFNHNEGDMRLDLLDVDGDTVDTSNGSTAGSDPDEQVEAPGSADAAVTYIAKVSLANAGSTNIIGQHYTLHLASIDNSVCLASEPEGGDNTFVAARCVGDFVSGSCVTTGCPVGSVCSNDKCAPQACSPSVACPSGSTCDASLSVCVDNDDTCRCDDNSDRCAAADTIAALNCPSTETCVLGKCVASPPPDCAVRTVEPIVATLSNCASTPNAAGCGRMCGSDDTDLHRIGTLNNEQVLRAAVDFDPALGDMTLALVRYTSTGTEQQVQSQGDTDDDGHIDLTFTASPVALSNVREYAVRVKPAGVTGHQAQRYALSIDVGDACFDDENDAAGTGGNDSPADATLIRVNPTNGVFTFNSTSAFNPDSSRCGGDVDVYEMFSFAGEVVSVQLLNAPIGLIAEVGTRPADLDDPAIAQGHAVAEASPFNFGNPVSQQLYITVKPDTGVTVTGSYSLRITVSR